MSQVTLIVLHVFGHHELMVKRNLEEHLCIWGDLVVGDGLTTTVKGEFHLYNAHFMMNSGLSTCLVTPFYCKEIQISWRPKTRERKSAD